MRKLLIDVALAATLTTMFVGVMAAIIPGL
jgi:hypothetical protein